MRKTSSVTNAPKDGSSHSTTEVVVGPEASSAEASESEEDTGIMDRADVLYKYILRSFRKHYCKNFNDVTEYRKRKRRVTIKLTLISAMNEFKEEIFPGTNLPDLEIYLLSLITHRVSPRIPKRN